MISGFNPVRSGEEIVLYAVGMGGPSGMGLTGRPPNSPLDTPVGIGFDFRPNAGQSRPSIKLVPQFDPAISPAFSAMIPAFVGLYQINVVIPQPPAGLPACEPTAPWGTGIDTNLTISIGERASFDGVGICVQPEP